MMPTLLVAVCMLFGWVLLAFGVLSVVLEIDVVISGITVAMGGLITSLSLVVLVRLMQQRRANTPPN